MTTKIDGKLVEDRRAPSWFSDAPPGVAEKLQSYVYEVRRDATLAVID